MIPVAFAGFFTIGRCFVIMLALIFGCFLWAGSETLLTRFGFETKTSLQQKLTQETSNRAQLEQTNKDLLESAVQAKKDQDRVLKTLADLTQTHQALEETTSVITQTLVKKSVQAKTNIEKKKVTTVETVTLPIEDLNTLSQANIDAVHAAFEQLQT